MFIAMIVAAYVLCSLLIGLAFHMLSIIDIVAEPGPRELFVFFAVFAVAGVPILAVTLAVVAFSLLFGNRDADVIDRNGLYEHGSSSL